LTRVELPGYNKDEIKLEIYDGNLTVLANKKEKDEMWDCSNEFSYVLNLPDYLDLSQIKAKLEHGVLIISIAKKDKQKLQIEVE